MLAVCGWKCAGGLWKAALAACSQKELMSVRWQLVPWIPAINTPHCVHFMEVLSPEASKYISLWTLQFCFSLNIAVTSFSLSCQILSLLLDAVKRSPLSCHVWHESSFLLVVEVLLQPVMKDLARNIEEGPRRVSSSQFHSFRSLLPYGLKRDSLHSYGAEGPESESQTRLGRNEHLIWEICSKTGCSGNRHGSGYLKGLKTAKQCHHPRGQGQDPSHFWPLDLSPSWHKCSNRTLAEYFPILPLSRSLGKGLLA